ncbi:MAG: response regulator [Deltaproteobacteria bacterium]|nr:response regulator [Deltaproteobacteria bacterium]MBI3389099.1 response regulator [Deltaproteobacteria bacterium]
MASPTKLTQFPPEYFERLIESSPDIVVATDRSGLVMFYNDGAEKNLGYTATEILGQNVLRLYPSYEEAHRVMMAMRSGEHGGPGKVKNFETIFVNRWGEHLPVAISGSILCNEDGIEIGSIGFAKDLREIRRKDRLATLGEVTVALCHEINSPLEIILNQAQLLRRFVREVANDEQAVVEEERLEAIRREIDQIQVVINRLVEMAGGGEYDTREYLDGKQMTDLGAKPAPVSAQPLAGLRILVVDDDLGVCRSLRDLLVAEGCNVFTANNGLEALSVMERAPVDLVVTDVVMPDLDGYDLFMEIKRRGQTPVILMTGYYYDRDHVIKRSRLEGLESVLFKKPVDPERLKVAILERCRPQQVVAQSVSAKPAEKP